MGGTRDLKVVVTAKRAADGNPYWGFSAEVGTWHVGGDAVVLKGQLVIANLEVSLNRPKHRKYPDGGITSTLLREIPIGLLLDEIRSEVLSTEFWIATGERYGFGITAASRELKQSATAMPSIRRLKGGRPRTAHAHYRMVAVEALRLQKRGVGGSVLLALSKKFQRRGEPYPVPHDTIREWIRRARELGYLAPGTAGRRSFLPGPRLVTEEREGGRRGTKQTR